MINLLEIIKNYSPQSKFFQPFSSNIFGDSKNKSQNEKEKFSPRSIYAIGKVTAFHACELYKKFSILKFTEQFFIITNLK